MSLKSNKSWFRRLGLAAIAALTLGVATVPTVPADAAVRLWAGPHGIHVGVVQHRHHDWWRQPYGYYYNPNSPRYTGWY